MLHVYLVIFLFFVLSIFLRSNNLSLIRFLKQTQQFIFPVEYKIYDKVLSQSGQGHPLVNPQ